MDRPRRAQRHRGEVLGRRCIRTELEGVDFITEKYEIQAMDERA